MTTKNLINKLQQLEDKHGDMNIYIYKSFSKETIEINDICYDDERNDVYFGIYA